MKDYLLSIDEPRKARVYVAPTAANPLTVIASYS